MTHAFRRIGLAAGLLIVSATFAIAQTVKAPVEHLDFDRPESWAMSWFTSATALGAEGPLSVPPGSATLGLEATLLPTLSPAQERVGFNGTAAQDLNKGPVFVRPRFTVGLPGGLAIVAAGTPPIRSFGVTPRLFALGLEWTMYDRSEWRVAMLGHGQVGTVTGAFVCPSTVLAFAPGSPGNATGCEAESSDVATLRYGGASIVVGRRLAHGIMPHLSAGIDYESTVFQLNARAFGRIDQTRLDAQGFVPRFATGLTAPLAGRFSISADAVYAPLVVRRTATADRTLDSLLTARALITYRIH